MSSRRILWVSSVAAIVFLWLASPSYALELNAWVVKAANNADTSIILRDGGVVQKGDRFGLRIEVDQPVAITVTFRDAAGEITTLSEDVLTGSSRSLGLPGNEGWYEIDAAQPVGAVRLSITALAEDGATAEQSFGLVVVSFGKSARAELPKTHGTKSYEEVSLIHRGAPVVREVVPSPHALAQIARHVVRIDRGFVSRGGGASVFKSTSPGVVLIGTDESFGSGSLLDFDGYILTNWHVVEGYSQVGVVFMPPKNGALKDNDVYLAEVIRVDEVADLALIKVEKISPDARVITLGTHDDIEIGSVVHAIGHPEGETWTYTRGYVSQLRENYIWRTNPDFEHSAEVIQTQTPINPGNSGGPLLTDEGLLIGVNSFVATGADGLNYAVSVSEIRNFLDATEDRYATREIQGEEQNIVSDDEPDIYEQDTDNNGIIDVTGLDFDRNGVSELYFFDPDEDGEPDYWLLDRNENGTPDGSMETELMDDGTLADVWFFDENEDGIPESVGTDFDRDGEIDRFKELS